MFTIGFLKMFSGLLKSDPYLILVGIVVFGALQLKSCNDELTKSKNEAQNQRQAVINQANKESRETFDKAEKSSKVTLESVINLTKGQEKIYRETSDREIKVKRDLSVVLDTFQNSSKDAEAVKIKDLEISTIQIKSIWRTYCTTIPQDTQCKESS